MLSPAVVHLLVHMQGTQDLWTFYADAAVAFEKSMSVLRGVYIEESQMDHDGALTSRAVTHVDALWTFACLDLTYDMRSSYLALVGMHVQPEVSCCTSLHT